MRFRKFHSMPHIQKNIGDATDVTMPEPPAPTSAMNPPRTCPWCPETNYRVSYQTHGLHFSCGGQYNPSVPHEHHPGAGCVEYWQKKYEGTGSDDKS